MSHSRLSHSAALALASALAEAAPLSAFDAYTAWDQPLPTLLEFVALEFPASTGASQYNVFDSRWDMAPGVAVTPAQPPLTLTAAEGGSTLRALEHIRFDGSITLIGDFTFEAAAIYFASTGNVTGETIHLVVTGDTDFSSRSPRVPPADEGSDLTLGPVSGEGSSGSGVTMGSGPSLAVLLPLPELVFGSLVTMPYDQTLEIQPVSGGYSSEGVDFSGSVYTDSPGLSLTLVPLPAALPLLVSGLGLLAARGRRRG